MKKFLHNLQKKISSFKKRNNVPLSKRKKRIHSITNDIVKDEGKSIEACINNTKYSTKCLHYKTDIDNYKCKRKQLKIDY